MRQPLANAFTTPELQTCFVSSKLQVGFWKEKDIVVTGNHEREAWVSYLPCRDIVREGYMAVECIEHTVTDFTFEEYRQ